MPALMAHVPGASRRRYGAVHSFAQVDQEYARDTSLYDVYGFTSQGLQVRQVDVTIYV